MGNIKHDKCTQEKDARVRRTCVNGTKKPWLRSKMGILGIKMLKIRKK